MSTISLSQFTVVVMNRNSNDNAYAHITLNGGKGCSSLAVGNVRHTVGTCTVILPLVAGDKVYVINPQFASKAILIVIKYYFEVMIILGITTPEIHANEKTRFFVSHIRIGEKD